MHACMMHAFMCVCVCVCVCVDAYVYVCVRVGMHVRLMTPSFRPSGMMSCLVPVGLLSPNSIRLAPTIYRW